MKASAPMRGSFLLETRPELYDRKQLAMSNGIVDIQPNVPFTVRVANFSQLPAELQRNERLGVALTLPAQVLAVKFEGEDAARTPNLTDVEGEGLATALSEEVNYGGTSTRQEIRDARDVDLDHLPRKLRRKVRKMLRTYEDMWNGQLGTVKVTKHRIETQENEKPVFSQPYRAGPEARKVVKESVKEMLDKNVIEAARTEWASPVVLVPKPDGTLRFCVDYRKLNEITVKDAYPLPRMDDCLDSLGDASVFTTLDCNSGYWQIPVAEEDREKTTFTCHEGCFQFKRMPFGLCNAPATFQRTLDILLAGYRWKSCLVYLDDIIIFSKSREEHIQHVEEVLRVLRDAGLSLKLEKCQFFTDTVDYLGHVIRPGVLEVAEKNTATIKGFENPKTQTCLRSFLGMCNVYRRFVPNFARVSAPLNKMLTKGEPYDLPAFTDEHKEAFNLLKDALIAPPILKLPRSDLPYSVDTDACDYQVGCALFQTYPDGTRHPVGFWSRTLAPAERNYSTGERECLAVIWAIQILRPYLERKHFDLYTDHQALKWMMSLTDVSGRLARWRLRLLEFDFTVRYRKGAANSVADAISRLPTFNDCPIGPDLEIPCFLVEEDKTCQRSPNPHVSLEQDTSEGSPDTWTTDDWDDSDPCMAVEEGQGIPQEGPEDVDVSPITIEELILAQAEDDLCKRLRRKLERDSTKRYFEDERGLVVRVSPLDGAKQIVAPESLRQKILYMSHFPRLAGHPGGTRMFNTIRRTFYWPAMGADVYRCAQNCISCARERVKLRKHA